jgi:glycerol-1-phosphate dehydrogenase [NAD(P)+]
MQTALLKSALDSATETEEMLVDSGSLESVARLFAEHFPGRAAVIVAASDTWTAAGSRVEKAFRSLGIRCEKPVVFAIPPFLHGDYDHIAELRDGFAAHDAIPIAVGGGTINDIVKRASSEAGRRYICVATAASVDGYTSSGAAILKDGFKQTLACAAPIFVVADPDVLAAAPAYLTSSGYGDLASKLVAGSDWIVADAVGSDPINAYAFRLTQEELRTRLSGPEKAAAGDPEAIMGLFEGLAMTGFSMQFLKSSRPVSGCEHLFSHVWEMEDLYFEGRPVTHGHKVAIGTLAATALSEVLLRRGFADIDPAASAGGLPSSEARAREVVDAFKGSPAARGAVDAALKVATAKLDPKAAIVHLERAKDRWTEVSGRVAAQLEPYAELREAFRKAGCPTKPEDIGLNREYAIRTAFRAQMIRDRYTVLDLMYEARILDECVGAVIADGTYLR